MTLEQAIKTNCYIKCNDLKERAKVIDALESIGKEHCLPIFDNEMFISVDDMLFVTMNCTFLHKLTYNASDLLNEKRVDAQGTDESEQSDMWHEIANIALKHAYYEEMFGFSVDAEDFIKDVSNKYTITRKTQTK